MMKSGYLIAKLKDLSVSMRPNIVVCFHWSLLPLALLLKVLFKSKIIYDEHDYYELNVAEKNNAIAKITPLIIRLFYIVFLKWFDLITCIQMNDNYLKKYLSLYNNRVIELHNYPLKKWLKVLNNTNASYQGKISFVYIGGIYKVKGCKAAADAFIRLNETLAVDAELHYFGSGDPLLIKWLNKQRRIVVHENVWANDIRDFMHNNSCIGLLIYETTKRYQLVGTNSRKMYEYLASGAPMVATPVGGIETFMNSNDVGYLLDKINDSDSLYILLKIIMDNRDELRIKARNCIRIMTKNQLWWDIEWEKVLSSSVFSDEKA